MLQSIMGSRFSNEAGVGFLMATNMFDLYQTQSGPELGFLGEQGLRMSATSPLDVDTWRAPRKPLTPGALAGGLAGASFGIAPALAIGYREGGVQGATNAVVGDVATHAALMRYHFGPAAKAGVNVSKTGLVAPGLLTGAGSGVHLGTRALNTAAYLGKGIIGGGIGGGIGGYAGGKVGGAIGGRAGNLVGSIGGTFAGSYLGAAGMSMLATPQGALLGLGLGAVALGAAATVGAAAGAGYGTYQTLKAGYKYRQMQKSIHTSGSLAAFNTMGAQTMRARAVSAIHKSHLNARSALGQEANLMHMPSRNYHSKYRRFY